MVNKFKYKKQELYKLNINKIITNDYLEIDKISDCKDGVSKELEIININNKKGTFS